MMECEHSLELVHMEIIKRKMQTMAEILDGFKLHSQLGIKLKYAI